jgi:hypothetical protein
VKPRTNGGIVEVTQVRPDLLLALVDGYVGLDIFNLSNNDRKDLAGRIIGPVQNEVGTAGDGKLFVVKGNLAGLMTLQAGDTTKDIEVISPARYTVSFRFLLQPKEVSDSSPSIWTKHTISEVDAWVSNLNWIFGSQANITFQLGTAQGFHAQDTLFPSLGHGQMEENFYNPKDSNRDYRDKNANFTVFVVGPFNYEGNAKVHAATNHPDDGGSWVTVIADDPVYDRIDYPPSRFIPVLCHELSHAIRKDYDDFDGDPEGISSLKKQNTKIGPLLRDALLHPPGSK